jgi:hypothetical protein
VPDPSREEEEEEEEDMCALTHFICGLQDLLRFRSL